MTHDDFRGIAISPVISKVFEHCIIHRFHKCLTSGSAQFGFKKNTGCRNAIYTARKAVEQLNQDGSTANICAIDLSKAFDKVNHHALYIKLMKKLIPNELLLILENWLSECSACVKWCTSWTFVFQISFGVRQGSVLAPLLFAVYIDDVSSLCALDRGCHIILYADDILLIAPTVSKMENLLHICERELYWLDMSINFKKSCCMRIGPRCDAVCANITSSTGSVIAWVSEIRYLGVYFSRFRRFKCSIDHAKRSFYKAANSVFGKIGRIASEEVTLQLVKSKCIPILLYGPEVCELTKSQMASLDFTINRFFMKLFSTSNIEIVETCQEFFGF